MLDSRPIYAVLKRGAPYILLTVLVAIGYGLVVAGLSLVLGGQVCGM